MTTWTMFNQIPPCLMVKVIFKKKIKGLGYDVGAINSLQQYASKFTLCFIKFWMKLDKFTMVKVDNLLINGDQLLWTSEFINNQLNSPMVNQIH
jgi:hypothetical protein